MSRIEGLHRIPQVKIVFDTSSVFTPSTLHLLSVEVQGFLKESLTRNDIVIESYLPETARLEREYQLRLEWLPVLTQIKRVEKLTGEDLKIDEQRIVESIKKTIDTQIADLGLQILSLEVDRVDWARLIEDAAFRRPPFSKTEKKSDKEKGFRDALISEAIIQLVERSPDDANTTRIVIIAGDGLLKDAIKGRTIEARNIHVLDSLDDLKSFINALLAPVSQELIKTLKRVAEAAFFQQGNKDTLYYKNNIKEQVLSKYSSIFKDIPEGADEVVRRKTVVSPPRFLEKNGERFRWSSRVTVRMEAYKKELRPSLPASEFDTVSEVEEGTEYSPFMEIKTLYKLGHISFEVPWSAEVTPANDLLNQKVEPVEFLEASYDD